MALDPAYALIFGGCCSNQPESGLLITVSQFVLVALFVLPSQLEYTSDPSTSLNGFPHPKRNDNQLPHDPSSHRTRLPRLRRPHLPPARIALMSFMFFATNILNNWAFAFSISVPLHIILRSFGSVTTLAVGALHGKRYSPVQVLSVLVLTVGVVVSAWADAQMKGKNTSIVGDEGGEGQEVGSLLAGVAILFVAQLLGAYMGVYTESTYKTYGRHWREMLFWSHVCGLGFSVLLAPNLLTQFALLRRADAEGSSLLPDVLAPVLPSQGMILLFLNAILQVACISGVNRLSAQTTAVTVTVVLNVRKLVSFLLSCVIFGNEMSGLMLTGAGIVFGAGAVYGWDGSRKIERKKGE